MTTPSHSVVAAAVYSSPFVALGAPWWVILAVALYYAYDAILPDYLTWLDHKLGGRGRWEMYPIYHDESLIRYYRWRFWGWGYRQHLKLDRWFHGKALPVTGCVDCIGPPCEFGGTTYRQWDDIILGWARWKWVWSRREATVVGFALWINLIAWCLR